VVIQRLLTDNAKAYAQSLRFAETAAGLGIRLKRTRPYRPQTNGKVERFNRTLLEEWAYARLYHSNDERRRAFTRWLRFYNHRRPHTSLDGLTPMAVLVNNVHGKHSWAAGLPADCAPPKPVACPQHRSSSLRQPERGRVGGRRTCAPCEASPCELEFNGRSKTQGWVLTPLCDRRSEVYRRHWNRKEAAQRRFSESSRESPSRPHPQPDASGRSRTWMKSDQHFAWSRANCGPART
jgi:hypothetical protein